MEDVDVGEGGGDCGFWGCCLGVAESSYVLGEARDGEVVVGVYDGDAGLAAAEVGGEDGEGGEVVEEMHFPAPWARGYEFDDGCCRLGFRGGCSEVYGCLDEAVEGGKAEVGCRRCVV